MVEFQLGIVIIWLVILWFKLKELHKALIVIAFTSKQLLDSFEAVEEEEEEEEEEYDEEEDE